MIKKGLPLLNKQMDILYILNSLKEHLPILRDQELDLDEPEVEIQLADPRAIIPF